MWVWVQAVQVQVQTNSGIVLCGPVLEALGIKLQAVPTAQLLNVDICFVVLGLHSMLNELNIAFFISNCERSR